MAGIGISLGSEHFQLIVTKSYVGHVQVATRSQDIQLLLRQGNRLLAYRSDLDLL